MTETFEERTDRLLSERQQQGEAATTDPFDQHTEELLQKRFQPEHRGVGTPAPPMVIPPTADHFLARSMQQNSLGVNPLDFKTRTDMGLNDTFDERQTTFKRYYPHGDIVQVHVPDDLNVLEAGQDIELFRRSPGEPFTRLDERGFAKGDIADMAGAAPAMAGELAMGLASRGASFITRAIATGFGGAAGEAARSVTQTLRGIKSEPATTTWERAAVTGLTSTLGAAAGDLIGLAIRPVTGVGLSGASSDALRADRFAKQAGLPRLFGGQMAESVFVQRLMNQAVAKSTLAGKRTAEQWQAGMDLLAKRVGQSALTSTRKNLAAYERASQQSVLQALRLPGTTMESSAGDLHALLQTWREVSKKGVDFAYEAARKIGDPVFDMRALKQDATSTLALAKAKALVLNSDMEAVLTRITQLPDDLTNITVALPDGGTATMPGAQVLNDVRSQFYRIAHPQPGDPALRTTREMALASDMGKRGWETFANPANADKLPGFKQAWKEAADLAGKRFDDIEKLDALLSLRARSFKPMDTVSKIFSAGNDDIVITLHSALRDWGMLDRWVPIQQGFRAELVRQVFVEGPDAARKTLAKFEPQTLARLMPKEQLRGFRETLKAASDLSKLNIDQLLKTQADNTTMIMKLVAADNSRAIDTLVKTTARNSPLWQSIRAGLIDHLLGHTRVSKLPGPLLGQKVLDPVAIRAEIAAFEKSGAIRFLTGDDLNVIHEVVNYSHHTGAGIDISAGLAGGQAAGTIGRFFSEPGQALLTLVHSIGLGRVLSSASGRGTAPVGKWITVGLRPGQRSDPAFLRSFGAMMLTLSQNMTAEETRRNESLVPRPLLRGMRGEPVRTDAQ